MANSWVKVENPVGHSTKEIFAYNAEIPLDENNTSERYKTTDNARKKTIRFSENGGTKVKNYNGYKFEFTTPPFANLEKDMPLIFSARMRAKTESNDVIEQVQAKVTFNLNGGNIGGAAENLEKVAPLNANYKYDLATGTLNSAYKANGFEGENRKMVDGVLADHNGYQLYGDELAKRQFPGKEATPTADPVKQNGSQKLKFLGWSTVQMTGTAKENTIAWNNKLQKAETAEETNSTTNHKFTATSPITKPLTVYAVWGLDLVNVEFKSTDKTKGTLTGTVSFKNKTVGSIFQHEGIAVPGTTPVADYVFLKWLNQNEDATPSANTEIARDTKDETGAAIIRGI